MAAIIAVNDLTKSYGRSRGVTHITFSVDEGEVFGFLGPNGAGKTTTIRVLMGLLHPTCGGMPASPGWTAGRNRSRSRSWSAICRATRSWTPI